MSAWRPVLTPAAGPKYLAIAGALSRDIETGVLAPGDRLPPQRALADSLGVDLTTVTRAYGEAQRLGLIEGSGRRGSFVRAKTTAAPILTDPGDIGMNAPPDNFGGTLGSEYRKSVEALLAPEAGAIPLQYQPAGGTAAVRQVGADALSRRAIPCHEDTVLVAAGGQHALHAIFSAELAPGDALGVAAYAYPGLISLARRFDVRLHPIASDAEGIDPDALEAACAACPLRGIYVVPANDNPTTASMSAQRRQALATVAERHGLLIIEDDAYGLLSQAPQVPFAALLPEQTWHVSSVSKVLAPGLRVAWLCAPTIARAWRLAADMHETAVMAPPLNAAVVADWIRSGVQDRLIGQTRTEARLRQTLAAQCLPEASYRAQPEGYHLWVPLGEDANPRQIADALRPHGISAIGADAFAVDRAVNTAAMRISIGGSTSHERLRRGLLLLAALIDPAAARRLSLV